MAYVVCFCSCLHLGAEAESNRDPGLDGWYFNRALTFFATMSAFGLCTALAFGVAMVTEMSMRGAVVASPLGLVAFLGLIVGDIYGCPRFLR